MEGDRLEAALAGLRREIDRIDEDMHRLLMERGEIIDRLIETKRTTATGSAFRPDREAAMLKALAGRHRGRLPLDAVEGIWRVIISTFTYVQAPFSVHACGDPARTRDSARFHFGFTVPYLEHPDAGAAIAAVGASRGDIALLPLKGRTGAWWRALEGEHAPKIIARLPFVERAGHPAGDPVLVVARTGAGSVAGDVALYSCETAQPDGSLPGLQALGGEMVARDGEAMLLAVPSSHTVREVTERLGLGHALPVPVGHHPPRFRVGP